MDILQQELNTQMKISTIREKEIRQLNKNDIPVNASNHTEVEKGLHFLKNDIKILGDDHNAIIGSFQSAKYYLVL